MNNLYQKQAQEQQETICKIHNLELIAVDMDLSDKAKVQFLCSKCLVEKIKNYKVTTIEQSKERIQQIKKQQKEIRTKENQARLTYYKNILDQIMNFKQFIDDSLDKTYKQIQQYIYPIQKEKQELQDYDLQLNYFEDVQQLSELYTQNQQQSMKLQEDNNFIDEISRQFELLLNSSEYSQTLELFKNTKETIKDFKENNVIELFQFITNKQNEFRTPSLNRICNNHKKEIIMIDMDSQSKKIEDRLVCVDCIAENPLIKYQTIQNVDNQWKEYNSLSENCLIELQMESKIKKSELLKQIAQMRKNYNKKLIEISDKLTVEQYLCNDQIKESNRIKRTSIQVLDNEQLIKDLKQLIEYEKKNEIVPQNQIIKNIKNKDSIFKKDLEYHFESLKQLYNQDIQQSLDILKEISKESNLITMLSEMIQQIEKSKQKDDNYQNQINIIKEIQELVDDAKRYQFQENQFEQTKKLYQSIKQKIELIQQNIKLKSKENQTESQSQLLKSQYSNIQNILNEYQTIFENNSIQMKKYCNIKQMEDDLIKLTENNNKLEIEKNNFINSIQKSLEQKLNEINSKLEIKDKEYKDIKVQYDSAIKDNINLKNQYEQEKMTTMKKFQDEQNKFMQELNQNLNLKNQELQEAKTKLDQINKDKLEQEKLYEMELKKIQLYQKSLSFSNAYKNGNCQVTEGGKVVADVGNSSWSYCLCEQAIPKTGKIQFAFQILNGSAFMVGIGFREIIAINLVMEHIQQKIIVLFFLIITKIYFLKNSHFNLQIMRQQQSKYVLKINTLNGVDIIIHNQYLFSQIQIHHKNYIHVWV
ncbi:unnamed protein product [Paramecium pentaurelia]|uniref:Uncharacterized protein n=1 Tax=Paramecium pentaurelia TaxID=43138 RepID=A0A8S1UM22_9CILI|nr:unnamed protein product [Paramecium pentaurelia]